MKEQKEEQENKVDKPKVSFLKKIPFSIKAILIKYWFYGMYYYFIIMGIGYFFQGSEDTAINSQETLYLVIIFCLFAGICNDLLLNTILDVIENVPGESKKYILFKRKKSVLSTLINLVYGFVWGLICFYIASLFASLNESVSWIGREPFTFALIALIIDFAFVLIKDGILYLVKKVILKKE